MHMTITVNSYSFTIDSIDPEILGKWMVEIFERVGPLGNADQVYVRAYPSFSGHNIDGTPRVDWIEDTRFVDTLYNTRTPREIIEALEQAISDYERQKNAKS